MEADFPQDHPVHVVRAHEGEQYQNRADGLAQDGGHSRAHHAHLEGYHKEKIQRHVQQGAENQEVERPLGVAHRPQNAGAHVVHQIEHHAGEINPDIGQGVVHNLLGGTHNSQGNGRKQQAHNRKQQAAGNAQRHRGVYGQACLSGTPGPVILGDNDRRAGGKAHEKAGEQVQNGAGGAAHGGQGLFAHKLAHHHGVHRVVQLLEECPQHNGEKEDEELFPDDALRDSVDAIFCAFHGLPIPPIILMMKHDSA